MFVILYIVLYAPAAIDHFIASWVRADPLFGIIAFVMASLAGFATAGFRLSDPSIVRRIKIFIKKGCWKKVDLEWWEKSEDTFGKLLLSEENSMVSVNNREAQFFNNIFNAELYCWLMAMNFIFDKRYSGVHPHRSSFGRLSTNFDEHRTKESWILAGFDIDSDPSISTETKDRLEDTYIHIVEYAPYVFSLIREMD